MEYAKGGNLRDMMYRNSIKKLTANEDFCLHLLAQIVLGMMHINENKIIHRDLKPENILLDEAGRVLICDFGLSKTLTSFSAKVNTQVGTFQYMAPQILANL